MNDLPALQEAIRKLHGCESSHVESRRVLEMFQGTTVWEGVVEMFDLIGHEKAKRCYAWMHPRDPRDGGGHQFHAVLELPPVNSAKRAVQVAIYAYARKTK